MESAGASPLRVLLVEDQPFDAELLEHALRRAGFTVRSTRVETEEAYLAALDTAPEVILADYTLPQFDAPRALSLLRERGLSIPFIVVTGAVSEEVVVECMRQGAADYLLKDRLGRLGPAVERALTEQRQREAQARAEEAMRRARDEFLSSVAHDLKTPLVAIQGMTQLTQRQLRHIESPETEQAAERLEAVVTAARRMAGLVDEMLDLTQLQMGRALELDRREMDLVALAQSAIEQYQSLSTAHHFHLETHYHSLLVAYDPTRLERVIGNLLSNAVKYSPNGGTITVRIEREADTAGEWAILTVSDEGLGIPAADLPRIFERFHRGANVVGQLQGTGIGLASARQIVEQHGGAISVQSVEGAGSSFTIRLPLEPRGSDDSVGAEANIADVNAVQ